MLYLINSVNMSGERVDRHKNGRAYNRFGLHLGTGIYWCPTVFARVPACVSLRGTQEMKFKLDFPHCPPVQVQVRSPDRKHTYPLSVLFGAQMT